jgi:hypothetical protein
VTGQALEIWQGVARAQGVGEAGAMALLNFVKGKFIYLALF